MQITAHPLAQGSHGPSEVHNKKCQFHLSSCLGPTQREDVKIKKHTAFMRHFNLSTRREL